ncbi:MAG: 4-vinyl reductase [Chloroflexota bacterium]|nr:4-vinyl reductase [Chloroflexota bacterium]
MPEDRPMPNDALRLFFLAIEDVMGKDGMKAVLRGAKLERYIDNYPAKNLERGVTFGEYARAEQAVEDFYGPRGAKAMLLRVGRATFNYGMKEQSAVLGLAGQALKAMPLPMTAKMKLLLDQMVGAANKTVNQPTRLEEDADAFTMIVDYCMCQFRPKHANPSCFITVGALTEAMKWLTEKNFAVQEVACMNLGTEACRYRIPKTPD